ncbi:MAG: acyl-CoA dehydrogenase family protein [Acidimicrobiales bacterium]
MSAIPLVGDDDRAALRKLARDVAERDIAPHAAEWDDTEEFAEASLAALRRADLFTVTVGEEYGGMGMGDVEAAIVLEELARVDVSTAMRAQLVPDGDGYRLEAYKNYVTGGHKAVACLVWCRFPGASPRLRLLAVTASSMPSADIRVRVTSES